MTVGMDFVSRFGSHMQAVKANKAGHYVYRTLQWIGKNSHGTREIPGNNLKTEKHDGNHHHNALNPDIDYA